MDKESSENCDIPSGIVSRRQFLRLSGTAIIALTLPAALRKPGMPAQLQAQRVEYPRQVIGRLSELETNAPVSFRYPWDHAQSQNFLIRLSERAGGGVGPDQNIVAFNASCTHQGGPLSGQFHGDLGVAGPCPLHWTTFDLTRHGMVISGHATQGLPQIILETEGENIVATGVMGLVFGYFDNRVPPQV